VRTPRRNGSGIWGAEGRNLRWAGRLQAGSCVRRHGDFGRWHDAHVKGSRNALCALFVAVGLVACTGDIPRPGPPTTPDRAASPDPRVVPDVVGENYLEALVAVDPPFRLLEMRYRVSPHVANGTILEQRPPAGSPVDPHDTEILVTVSISPAEQLRGTDWVLGIVDGRTWPVGNAPDVTLSFGLRRISGFSGCNEYSSGYEMDGRRLLLGRVVTTLIACTGERTWVEGRVLEILQGSPIATVDRDELRLTSLPEGVATFDRL